MFTTSSARRVARLIAALRAPRRAPPSSPMRMQARTTLAALTVATLFTACAMPTHPDAKAPPPDPFNPAATQLLDDTSWDLTSWKQADGTSRSVPGAEAGGPITLVLTTATGQRRASGFSGCNRYMGTYALKDGKLSLGPLAGTRMACATPGGELEGPYLDALAHIDRTGVQMRAPQELQLILENGATLTFARHTQ